MNASSSVSVVIPVYNGEAFLGDCLNSVLAQTHTAWEALVVDDGSRDRSAAIAREFAARDPRVRLLQHPGGENRGVSSSRQLGVSQAQGQYVAFLDADDLFAPHKLAIQLSALDEHRDCILCHSAVEAFSAHDAEQAREFQEYFRQLGPQPLTYRFHERLDALRVNPICNSSVLVRVAPLRAVQFAFSQLFQFEDYLLWTLLSLSGPFLYLPDQLGRYRVHEQAASASVCKNRLVRIYSQIEFLLSVKALVPDVCLKRLADLELREALSEAMAVYAERGGNQPQHLGGLALESNDEAVYDSATVAALNAKLQQLQQTNARLSETIARFENHPILGPLLRLRARFRRWRESRPAPQSGRRSE